MINESIVLRDLFESYYELGGADRDRTDDPRLAKPVLSQLSYSPLKIGERALERSHQWA
jgi:hypothetical protein